MHKKGWNDRCLCCNCVDSSKSCTTTQYTIGKTLPYFATQKYVWKNLLIFIKNYLSSSTTSFATDKRYKTSHIVSASTPPPLKLLFAADGLFDSLEEENAYIKVLAKRDGGRGSGFMVLLKLNRKTLNIVGRKKEERFNIMNMMLWDFWGYGKMRRLTKKDMMKSHLK